MCSKALKPCALTVTVFCICIVCQHTHSSIRRVQRKNGDCRPPQTVAPGTKRKQTSGCDIPQSSSSALPSKVFQVLFADGRLAVFHSTSWPTSSFFSIADFHASTLSSSCQTAQTGAAVAVPEAQTAQTGAAVAVPEAETHNSAHYMVLFPRSYIGNSTI